LKRSSASQEIHRIFLNPKIHNRIHKSPPPVPVLSQISPVHGYVNAPHCYVIRILPVFLYILLT